MDISRDIKEYSDEELDEVLTRNENSTTPDSLFKRAVQESMRRSREREEKLNNSIIDALKDSLPRIITLLEKLANRPTQTFLFVVGSAILIGVLVNVITEAILRLLHLK